MILHNFKLPDNFDLFVRGDIHVGNAAVSVKAVQTGVRLIEKNKGATFWCDMGDACEAIHVGDKRFSTDVHAGKFQTINAQVDYYLELHKPILDRMLFMLDGNHEAKLHHIVDVADMVARGLPNLVHGGFSIRARMTDKFNLFAIHGWRQISSMAGSSRQREVNDGERLKRILMRLRGDCHAMVQGHIHRIIITPPSQEMYIVNDERGEDDVYTSQYNGEHGVIHPDSRWYGSTGSCLRSYVEGITTYSEMAMYPPAELGMIKLIVRDKELQRIEKVILPKE